MAVYFLLEISITELRKQEIPRLYYQEYFTLRKHKTVCAVKQTVITKSALHRQSEEAIQDEEKNAGKLLQEQILFEEEIIMFTFSMPTITLFGAGKLNELHNLLLCESQGRKNSIAFFVFSAV